MDWSIYRTDKALPYFLKSVDGDVVYDDKGRPSTVMLYVEGSAAYRAAYTRAKEVSSNTDEKDEQQKSKIAYDADIQFLLDIIESVDNLEFEGQDCSDKKVLKQFLCAVSPIRTQLFVASRKPSDFLKDAPGG